MPRALCCYHRALGWLHPRVGLEGSEVLASLRLGPAPRVMSSTREERAPLPDPGEAAHPAPLERGPALRCSGLGFARVRGIAQSQSRGTPRPLQRLPPHQLIRIKCVVCTSAPGGLQVPEGSLARWEVVHARPGCLIGALAAWVPRPHPESGSQVGGRLAKQSPSHVSHPRCPPLPPTPVSSVSSPGVPPASLALVPCVSCSHGHRSLQALRRVSMQASATGTPRPLEARLWDPCGHYCA